MSKSLQSKAHQFLDQELGNLNLKTWSNSYEILFKTVQSLTKAGDLVLSQNLFNKLLSFQTKKGIFDFPNKEIISPFQALLTLSYLLEKEPSLLKYYKKYIKLLLIYMKTNFHEEYLLFSQNQRLEANENALFLGSCDILIEILNVNNFNKWADELFIYKERCELGFKRYFQVKEKELISSFSPQNLTFTKASELDKFGILKVYNYNSKELRIIVSKYSKKLNTQEDILFVLDILLELQKEKQTLVKNYLDRNKEYLSYFPEYIVPLKEISKSFKSLFSRQLESKRIKDKEILISKKNLLVASKIFELLSFS